MTLTSTNSITIYHILTTRSLMYNNLNILHCLIYEYVNADVQTSLLMKQNYFCVTLIPRFFFISFELQRIFLDIRICTNQIYGIEDLHIPTITVSKVAGSILSKHWQTRRQNTNVGYMRQ